MKPSCVTLQLKAIEQYFHVVMFIVLYKVVLTFKGLFTWREGAPANRATQLEGLKHSPPLHATHLIGTVSGLHELSPEQPLSSTNITADQGNFFPSYFSFLDGHWPVLCLRLIYYIDLFRLTVTLFGREHWQMVTTNSKCSLRTAMSLRLISPRLAEIGRLKPFKWQKATPPSRVPRASKQGAPGRRATLSSM